MRGRRVLPDIIRTRPQHVVSKEGTSGNQVVLKTNYFRIKTKPQWSIYQYRVDFAPDIELTAVRKGILRQHKNLFNGYLFDGTVLYTLTHFETKTIQAKRLDGSDIKIDIRFIKQTYMTEQAALQVLNVIVRSSMEGLRLQLVGRNFFDPIAKVKPLLSHSQKKCSKTFSLNIDPS